jgi:cytoskeletal protein RodZ
MLALDRVGDRLRAARLAAGLALSDIADKTRVPLRHLEAIESNDFSTLPSFTYATGFVRAFARVVGEDEVALIRDLRVELGRDQDSWTAASGDNVADPARIPPKWLAWTAALIMLAFVGGYGLWRSTLFDPQSAEAEQAPVAPRPAAPVRPAPPPVAALPTGPVLLMAIDDVWVKIYDSSGKSLFQGIIKKGESYVVPPEANGPMIRTGRADQIAVTIGGVSVPPLGPANMTISNVPINAAALAARPAAPAAQNSGPASGAATPPTTPEMAPAMTPARTQP